MPERILQLEQQAREDLLKVQSPDDLEQFRIRYLGSKGALKKLMGLLKEVPGDQKRAFGQQANALRETLQTLFAQKQQSLGSPQQPTAGPKLDVTEPGLPPRLGRTHVITQTIADITDIFGRMGFDIATGPQVEDDYHNFIALNIPPQHPARDPLDNFYLATAGATQEGGSHMLRSQTSTVQIRVMEKRQPPIRVVSTGRVYRPDEHDATHYSMFHQIEGLYVDRKVTMVDLKTTLIQFARAYFGADTEVRLVPSYFPFTEPSAELYVKMTVRGRTDWVELGGCGMVDPAVFEAVGYDPEQWTGFAFGMGVERIAMRKFAIADIRWLFENDVRFLRQF